MKIKSVRIQNFRAIKDETISFEDLSVIIGNNGSSKTTILEAIQYCMSVPFFANKVKYTDFYNGGNDPIHILITFDQEFQLGLIDGFNEKKIACDRLYLFIKKRDSSKGVNKAFTDGFVIKHYAVPVASKIDETPRWSVPRQSGKNFEFTDRQLSEATSKGLPVRFFYFDKSREKQMLLGYNTSLTSVFNDFNWHFVKEKVDSIKNQFDLQKNEIEELIISTLGEKVLEKSFSQVNEELKNLTENQVSFSFINQFEPFNTVSLVSKMNDIELPLGMLGSGIEMVIALVFLISLASLSKESIVIGIDEPEIHLHPKLQMKLVEYLKSKTSTCQVIFCTHSPYFFKDLKNENGVSLLTRGEDSVTSIFPWGKTWSEINYFTYGIPSPEFHNELYGYLQLIAIEEDPDNERELHFDGWLRQKGCSVNKNWIRERGGIARGPISVTLMTYIRNTIHHPENKLNVIYTMDEFEESICFMISLIRNEYNCYA